MALHRRVHAMNVAEKAVVARSCALHAPSRAGFVLEGGAGGGKEAGGGGDGGDNSDTVVVATGCVT